MRAHALTLALVLAAGCTHHQTVVPGVLDMRTDGKGAPRGKSATRLDPKVARAGVEGMLQGNGVLVNGSEVTIEDRHYWIAGMLPIYNADARPELATAVGLTGALVDVEIGEEYSAFDIIGGIFARSILPITSWVTPSWTFEARGTLVNTGRPPSGDDTPEDAPDPEATPLPLVVTR